MKNGINIVNIKKQKKSMCHQGNLLLCLTNSGQRSLTMFISSCFNNYSIDLKNKNIIIVKPPVGFEPATPWC